MEPLRFVVQKHHARTLHYDFRLERGGVFKSWAVPKEIPVKLGIQRLALETEDHDLSFGDFEGQIPNGEYGAGTIDIWDRGVYLEEEWNDRRITIVLSGTTLKGRYRFLRFLRGGERAWLLSKTGE